MNRYGLEMFLPAFVATVVFFASFWAARGSRTRRIFKTKDAVTRRIGRVRIAYKVLLAIAMVISLVYSFFPEYYDLFVPIAFLDHPAVNTAGVLILKISLAWVVVAQLNINNVIFQINSGLDDWSYQRLTLYSQKLMLSGLLVMFFGFFVTISNLATVVICLVGIGLFESLSGSIYRKTDAS